jgi:hypothetical protein
VRHTHLYSLCMKAVWTTFGCCAAAAAPTAGALLPLGDVFPASPFASLCGCDEKGLVPLRSWGGQFSVGGPIVNAGVGVMSMGSRGGASDELDEGRMGIDRWRFGSPEKGLLRASATEAMAKWELWRGSQC